MELIVVLTRQHLIDFGQRAKALPLIIAIGVQMAMLWCKPKQQLHGAANSAHIAHDFFQC